MILKDSTQRRMSDGQRRKNPACEKKRFSKETRPMWRAAAIATAFSLISGCLFSSVGTPQPAIPHLRKQGTANQLVVGGKPFLVLGGELGNSTSSSLEYMRPIWQKLVSLNLNTVLAPVYWELIEPDAGRFDFTLVDGLLQESRKHQLRLVLLWFASWKNSMSCYAPAWVKTNQKRFPRSQDKMGRGMEILSPFSQENAEADARAFAGLMRHLREVDGRDNTVIMVQVENEIGMILDSRDRSAIANELYNRAVPPELLKYLEGHKDSLIPEFRELWASAGFRTSGTWDEVFGHGIATDEIFMAWYFARYTNHVAERGKAEYPLPMYANAALIRAGYLPGQYPSAGPLPHLMDVWRAGAPEIDFLAPDIYFPNFAEWCRKYQRSGNALFIPEAVLSPLSSVNALYAIGQHDAIGFSPFSIESIQNPEGSPLAKSYAMLTQLAPLIIEKQGKALMAGLLPEGDQRAPQQVRLGGYTLNTTYERPLPPASSEASRTSDAPSGGVVIVVGPDEFVFAGTGLIVTFDSGTPGDQNVGILSAQEGTYVNGQWVPGRWLNGDQTHQGRHLRLAPGKFDIQRIKLYHYR
jgi:beta-galactosidase GanA